MRASVLTWLLALLCALTTGCAGSDVPSDRDEAILLDVLKRGRPLAPPDGSYELTVKRVDGRDLLGLEVKIRKDGKVCQVLKSTGIARLTIDRDAASMKLFVEKCTLETDEYVADMISRQFDLPLPQME
jgi:hypothetical protein